ncbi:MAG: DNA ligase D [Armatimonadetes bacterium]|nr:DNA ligase D [Armatimonadota bacterium]
MSDKLEKYKRKRDFSVTSEPEAHTRASKKQLVFCVQRHDATRLHYDLRLEHDGVLMSWAVPKGPSLDPAEKRLAVHVEDHPLDYATFEGRIPKGQYGAGEIFVWDIGTWEPEGDVDVMMKKGDFKFNLHGKRLHGKWVLVRMDEKNWLLIKEKDKYVVAGDGEGLVERYTKSVLQDQGRPSQLRPKDFRPQLATVTERAPEGTDWLHEVKFDGYRILAWKRNGEVTLMSRNGLDWTPRFKKIAAAINARFEDGACVDGEVVVLSDDGTSDFGGLQNWLSDGKGQAPVFYLFDIVEHNGIDLTDVPLVERKARLEGLLEGVEPPLFYSDHAVGNGPRLFKEACKAGLEGIVSKRADSRYLQTRTSQWLKSKCAAREEFVIGGFTEGKGSRSGFGALLVGQRDESGRLIYTGRVGSGFNETRLDRLALQLKALVRETSPFVDVPKEVVKEATWVEPRLVAEVKYAERTREGVLRHPVFTGLREDKSAEDVQPERVVAKKMPVKISSPEKLLFPDVGLTKSGLAEYYLAIGEAMLPTIEGRPLAVVRCPDGIEASQFVQKHPTPGMPDLIKAEFDGEVGMVVNNVEGILTLVQNGTVEFHPWGCKLAEIERPDVLVFDLDPAPDVEWSKVVESAKVLAEYVRSFDLVPFVKTTGGKGLHVVVPLVAGTVDWEGHKQFAKKVVENLNKLVPGHFVTIMTKSKRKGKIFLDYLRNGRGATAVGAYSVRARPGAPVSTPLTWEELEGVSGGGDRNVLNLREWMPRPGRDPWQGFESARREISKRALDDLSL